MKTSHIAIILGIIISSSVVFTLFFELPVKTEHYDIEIFGLKDAYVVGEPYSFSYIISGYGYSCGDREVTYPDENGNTVRIAINADCNTGLPKMDFVIDSKDESEIQSIGIKNPGRYNVSVMFYKSTNFEPTQSGKEFHVVEQICNNPNPEDKVQCFSDSFDSCTSAYIKTKFFTVEGDPIYVIGVVESWYDCKLRVYLDTTQDRYGGHSTGVLRSICDDVVMNEDYWTITGCNNYDLPPKIEYGT